MHLMNLYEINKILIKIFLSFREAVSFFFAENVDLNSSELLFCHYSLIMIFDILFQNTLFKNYTYSDKKF